MSLNLLNLHKIYKNRNGDKPFYFISKLGNLKKKLILFLIYLSSIRELKQKLFHHL